MTVRLIRTNSSRSSEKMSVVNYLRTASVLLLNMVSSILVVVMNKWIYTTVHFPNITLTLVHFVVTFIGLYMCSSAKIFQKKAIALDKVVSVATTFCGFVVFTNLSLGHNSVGTYQVTKVLTTPTIVILQYFFYKKPCSWMVSATLIPIIAGVLVNYYSDLNFNPLGCFYGLVGVIVTSFYQILVGEKQQELQVNSPQLLLYQAPMSAGMLALIIPYCEPMPYTYADNMASSDWMLVFSSGVVALFVNITIYWIIGNTSPLTYNMLGHFKFAMTCIAGFLLFDAGATTNQIIGVGCTLLGVIAYTHVKLREKPAEDPKDDPKVISSNGKVPASIP